MDKVKKASILCKRLVPIITIAIFAIILFLRNNVNADNHTFTFGDWTYNFTNSGSTITTKWDPTDGGRYFYMNYGGAAASGVPHYRTMKVTITESTVDKNYFEYESDDLWTAAVHQKNEYANGKIYTLFSIEKNILNNILQKRCNKTLEEKAAESTDGTATVYLQSSYKFLDGSDNLITDNNGKGFYNYKIAYAEAMREHYTPLEYFTGYNIPFKLTVPKRVNLYLQSYTAEGGGSTKTKITTAGYREVSRISSVGRNVSFKITGDITFNSISVNGSNDVMNIPMEYTNNDRKYYLWKVLVDTPSVKKYEESFKSLKNWKDKMDSVDYDAVSNYASGGSTDYHNAIQSARKAVVPTNDGSSSGNIVVRAIYSSVKRSLTVNYYEATKSNGKYKLPTSTSEVKTALNFYLGDTLKVKFHTSTKTEKSNNKFVASTSYKSKFIYKAVLIDGKGAQKIVWPGSTDAEIQNELYKASGCTAAYKEDAKQLREKKYYSQSSNGNYTLKLYYVQSDKVSVNVNFRYLDWQGNEIREEDLPSSLPTSLAPVTKKIGETWKLVDAKGAKAVQGKYYYNSYIAEYYKKDGLGVTSANDPESAKKQPAVENRDAIKNEFANLQKSKSYTVYGDINVTITYKAEKPVEQFTYTVNKHFYDENGSFVGDDSKVTTYGKGSRVPVVANGAETYQNNDYAWYQGKATGTLSVDTTTNRSDLDKQVFYIDKNTVVDLYFRRTKFYTVTAYWQDWDRNDILTHQVVDRIEVGKAFSLANYVQYFYLTLPTKDNTKQPLDHIPRKIRQVNVGMENGPSRVATSTDEMKSSGINGAKMVGNVILRFLYIPQVPVNVEYYDDSTDTLLDSTVLYASKYEDSVVKISDYAETDAAHPVSEYKTKILQKNLFNSFDGRITYLYTGYAEFKNFADGNFDKKKLTLTQVCNQTVTIPKKTAQSIPKIVLHYTPMVDLRVKYMEYIDGTNDREIRTQSYFTNAFGYNKEVVLGSHTSWANTYYLNVTGADGNVYNFDTKHSIRIDYKGDDNYDITSGIPTIDKLKEQSITPLKKVITVTIYYKYDAPKKTKLNVQRYSTDGRKISEVKLVKWYNKDDTAYLQQLRAAKDADASGSTNWLTESPTEAGFTSYKYAGKIGIIQNGKETPYDFTLADVANQSVTMSSDTTIRLYYDPNYTLTINYYKSGSTYSLMASKTYNMGFRNKSFSLSNLGSSFLPETINSIYAYNGQYKWDGTDRTGTMSQVRGIGIPSLSSDHVLNLYYEEMPTTYVRIYVVDDQTKEVILTTDSIQQQSQKKTVGQLFASDPLGNLLVTDTTPDLTDYGVRKLHYEGKYKLVERPSGSEYNSLTVPGDPDSGTLDTVRSKEVYKTTSSYDLYLYYKKQVNVQVIYVNAETGEIVGAPPEAKTSATIGGEVHIDHKWVTERYTMLNLAGNQTEGCLAGYANNDKGSYDAGSAPEDYTPVSSVQQVYDSGVLDRSNIQGDYYVYLYYQVPYKITIHYFYNGEERTDMGKTPEPVLSLLSHPSPSENLIKLLQSDSDICYYNKKNY